MKPADLAKKIWLLIPLMLLPGAALCAADGGSGFTYGQENEKNAPCLACHGDARNVKGSAYINPAQFGHTTHARIGCPTCHSVNSSHPDGVKSPRPDCRECHVDVNTQYARSIHAGKTHCAGCHNPHKVSTPMEISGQEINQMCARCHDGLQMTAKHGEWLPQSDLHLRMLPCITCHTGAKEYYVSMYIVKGKDGSRFGRPELASYTDLSTLAGGKELVSLIDTDGDRFVSIKELRAFNRDPSHKELRLQGMMTPQTMTHNFEIMDSRRNCTFCHASGAGPMQTSYISLPQENGTFLRMPAERGAVLDALYGTPDFYLMGSTKNVTLNYVGLAIICGGLIMPVGHGFLRFLTRKNRQRKEH